MFKNFDNKRIDVDGIKINLRIGGSGPPLLLLHGYPQSHVCWHLVAPLLASHFTVVCSDLRGYGDSDCPPSDHDHEAYCKRVTARDQVQVMAELGFQRFFLAGHDRGARVAFRLARDFPDQVQALALLDIVPTADTWAAASREMMIGTYHWGFLAQPFDLPERLMAAEPDFYLRWTLNSWAGTADFFTDDAYQAYLSAFQRADIRHAMCEDYRAGAGIDLRHDSEDQHIKLKCPLLVLWGRSRLRDDEFPYLDIWRRYADQVSGHAVNCGHFLPEEKPGETADVLLHFFQGISTANPL